MSTDFSFLPSLQFVQRSLAYLDPSGEHSHQFEALNALGDYIEDRFKPHYRGLLGPVELEVKEQGGKIKLAVPYYSQLDNETDIFGPGGRQCNTTSCAMLCDYLTDGALSAAALERGEPEPEAVYDNYVAKYGDTTSHEIQTKVLKVWGVES
ncbi:MAG: hypothetical protein AB4050_19615 [Synechococcus sp.]